MILVPDFSTPCESLTAKCWDLCIKPTAREQNATPFSKDTHDFSFQCRVLNTNHWSCCWHGSVFLASQHHLYTFLFPRQTVPNTSGVSTLWLIRMQTWVLLPGAGNGRVTMPKTLRSYFGIFRIPSKSVIYPNNCHVTENALKFTFLSLFYPARRGALRHRWLVLTKSLPAERLSPRRVPGLTSPVGKHLASQVTQKYSTAWSG